MNTNLALENFDTQQYAADCFEQELKGENFPVDFDIAWRIAGYSKKSNAKRVLPKNLEGELYTIELEYTGARPKEIIKLTCDGLKHLCLMANTKEGYEIRQYFIECEKKYREQLENTLKSSAVTEQPKKLPFEEKIKTFSNHDLERALQIAIEHEVTHTGQVKRAIHLQNILKEELKRRYLEAQEVMSIIKGFLN